MKATDILRVRVTSGWGSVAFDLSDPSLDDFVRVAAALSQWHSVDLDSLIITERDAKSGRFKRRAA